VKIACVGGGPAGLYFALLMKLGSPSHDVTVIERDCDGSAYGWGVTFGGDVLDELHRHDPVSAREIGRAAFHWTGQVVDIGGNKVRREVGNGYSIRRHRLVGIMANRARDLGVHIEFGHEVTTLTQVPEADLVAACDGANSRIRLYSASFGTSERTSTSKYMWLGTDMVFESFTYAFAQTDNGWVWAYAYGVDAGSSTFIVECSRETWTGLGFDSMPLEDSLGLLEKLFARQLDGHRLARQAEDNADIRWLSFRTISNKRWHDGRVVLAGDAAHTAHYSIGWGTKLAIEDAISLAGNLHRAETVETALRSYEAQRRAALVPPQGAALLSAQWFENISHYIGLEPHQFSMLLHGRQSPILPHVSPRLYYQFLRATDDYTILRELRRRAGPRIKAIHSRRDPEFNLHSQPIANAELGPMRIFLIHPQELGQAEIASWHSMQQATPELDNPFLSPEFAVAVGRARPDARVAVLMDGNSTLGFFPYERHRLGLGARDRRPPVALSGPRPRAGSGVEPAGTLARMRAFGLAVRQPDRRAAALQALSRGCDALTGDRPRRRLRRILRRSPREGFSPLPGTGPQGPQAGARGRRPARGDRLARGRPAAEARRLEVGTIPPDWMRRRLRAALGGRSPGGSPGQQQLSRQRSALRSVRGRSAGRRSIRVAQRESTGRVVHGVRLALRQILSRPDSSQAHDRISRRERNTHDLHGQGIEEVHQIPQESRRSARGRHRDRTLRPRSRP
jgi:2-polyprenyl-6-methoxyphenol hydroxylase-like FAD-dependent oxidoreductase